MLLGIGGEELSPVTEEAVPVASCQHSADEERTDPTLKSIRGHVGEGDPVRGNGERFFVFFLKRKEVQGRSHGKK